ncbi:hypothetical protein [Alicyclobacillus fodiniaquatilis]|uniref:Uncharacterized protein n=1 Tax=Alicyclobacillus fodiniaquatilis TaxID=1661150 RepID=A0ABW4JJG4_9BACL
MPNRKPRRDSAKCSIINRTVSFNIEDPFQAQLLAAVDQWTNFSGGVKRLIAASLSPQSPIQMQSFSPIMQAPEGQNLNVTDDADEWDPIELL